MSSRATTVQVARTDEAKPDAASGTSTPAPDAEKTPKIATRKMYYLSCLACRWTSRDAGLPDQTNGTYDANRIELKGL